MTPEFDYKEFHFLTQCYQAKINEQIVYTSFIEKYLLDSETKLLTIDGVQTYLKNHYAVTLPATLIQSCFSLLNQKYDFLKEEQEGRYRVGPLPDDLKNSYRSFQSDYLSSQRYILGEFNQYRLQNGQRRLNSTELDRILNSVKSAIIAGPGEFRGNKDEYSLDDERVFLDWVFSTYAIDDSLNQKLKEELNKLLYSLLVFSSFTSTYGKRTGSFKGKKAYLDTNLIIFSFGVNGIAKQKYAREFLILAQANGLKLAISRESMRELQGVIKAAPNPEIRIFKKRWPRLVHQLLYNTKATVEQHFRQLNIEFQIDSKKSQDSAEKFPNWKNLRESLASYETAKGKAVIDVSLDHDIHLIAISDIWKPSSDIYEHKSILVTGDLHFSRWFNREYNNAYHHPLSGLLDLDRITLLLWAEGELSNSTGFISNTWMYIADSIKYFKDNSANSIFRVFRDSMNEAENIPASWRAPYLLLGNKVRTIGNTATPGEEEIVTAIRNVVHEDTQRLYSDSEKLKRTSGEITSLKRALGKATDLIETFQKPDQQKDENAKLGEAMRRHPIRTSLKVIAEEYPWLARIMHERALFEPLEALTDF